MTELPQKLDLRSHDIAEDKRQELLRLFPEIRTEGDKLDFDRLKLALGEARRCWQRALWHELARQGRLLQNNSEPEPRDAPAVPRGERQFREHRESNHRGRQS